MVEEVVPNIFRLEIPLPANPLKALSSYVIKGAGRTLIVDCGMRRKECREAMLLGLSELGVDLNTTDFFITHFHADHLGLVSDLAKPGARIYMNRPDSERLISNIRLADLLAASARLQGFPLKEVDNALRIHPGSRYGPELPLPFTMPEDGETISAGPYTFRCVVTPGHSFGHTCLYEPKNRILIAGDHVLSDITPNIQAWVDNWNPVKEYLISLDKVARLDVDIVLPGHRRVFKGLKARIEELKEHHENRAEEALTLLEDGPRSAYQLASGMTWDIVCDSFDLFPLSQKWFATGEAIAHLLYLEETGKVGRELGADNTYLWHKV